MAAQGRPDDLAKWLSRWSTRKDSDDLANELYDRTANRANAHTRLTLAVVDFVDLQLLNGWTAACNAEAAVQRCNAASVHGPHLYVRVVEGVRVLRRCTPDGAS